MRIRSTLAALAVAASTVVAAPAQAGSWEPVMVTDGHLVIQRTNYHHCAVEDGSYGWLPCTWNYGSTDGNGQGLTYWLDVNRRTHYAWPSDPTGHHGWRWMTRAERQGAHAGMPHRLWYACAIRVNRDDTATVKCPDGFRVTTD